MSTSNKNKGRGLLLLMFGPVVACIALAIITGATALFVFAAIAWLILMAAFGAMRFGANASRARR